MSERHARHRRSPSDRRRRPVDGSRAASTNRFERIVADAVASLPPRLSDHLEGVRIAIEDVPPAQPRGVGDEVPLGRFDVAVPGGREAPRDGSPPDRLVLYRRPLEARAISQHDLADLVRQTLSMQIARQAGIDDDPGGFDGS